MCRENFKDIICYHNENIDNLNDILDEEVYLDTFTSKIAITFLVSVILLYLSFFILVGIYGIYISFISK
jgi:hypothetical protein